MDTQSNQLIKCFSVSAHRHPYWYDATDAELPGCLCVLYDAVLFVDYI